MEAKSADAWKSAPLRWEGNGGLGGLGCLEGIALGALAFTSYNLATRKPSRLA